MDNMAWNPTPEVAVARDAAKRLGADRIVLTYTTKAGQIGYASYGETKALCAETKRLADRLHDESMQFFDGLL
jgi:hypothetical protein